jgi:mRNA interferase RelE/StbE
MEVFLSTKADRQLKKIPSGMYDLLLSNIQSLSITPFPKRVKKLKNREGWRRRVGDYRILYTVNRKKKEVTILSVAHRKDAYRHQ